jgi:NADPH:quinone reductase-like Zn-dependent oxidoreductase
VGKRVSFTTLSGSWVSYAVADASSVWVIDSSVPLCSAASGIVNPVTVMGMVDTFQKWEMKGEKGKGIIHTAASSAL